MVRFIRKLRAFIHGTFVTDCPRCHRHFYGFNNHGKQITFTDRHFRIVCHRCMEEHKVSVMLK